MAEISTPHLQLDPRAFFRDARVEAEGLVLNVSLGTMRIGEGTQLSAEGPQLRCVVCRRVALRGGKEWCHKSRVLTPASTYSPKRTWMPCGVAGNGVFELRASPLCVLPHARGARCLHGQCTPLPAPGLDPDRWLVADRPGQATCWVNSESSDAEPGPDFSLVERVLGSDVEFGALSSGGASNVHQGPRKWGKPPRKLQGNVLVAGVPGALFSNRSANARLCGVHPKQQCA